MNLFFSQPPKSFSETNLSRSNMDKYNDKKVRISDKLWPSLIGWTLAVEDDRWEANYLNHLEMCRMPDQNYFHY